MIVGAYRRAAGAILTIVAASALALAGSSAAGAVGANEVGVFPSWSTAGASGSYTGTAEFPASAGFPGVTVGSDSTTIKAPSGETAFLGASTAFGQNFGSSRSQPYLYVSSATGQANSTTTLTFNGAPPPGWGFALGDVDADWVFVQAFADAAQTAPLPIGDLGFQGVGNYCANVPKPSTCAGSGPFTDQPTWITTPTTIGGINYVPSTLAGGGSDTAGAYGWFTPSSTIRSLKLTFGVQSGFPIYQLWLASPAPATTITGTVAIEDAPPGTAVPAGTVAVLDNADGTPVLAIDETPVTVPVQPDGTYTFTTEQRPSYQIAIDPPPGYTAPAPMTVVANTATVAVPPVVVVAPPVVTPPPTSPPATPSPTPTASITPDPALAATGMDIAPWGFGAAALVVLGALAFAVTGLKRRSSRMRAGATARIR